MRYAVTALLAGMLTFGSSALAQEPAPQRESAPAILAQPAASPIIPTGTPLLLEVVGAIDSHTARRGDPVTLRVAEPIVVNGETLVAAGAIAHGEVVDAKPSDSGGQPGMLVVAGRYLEVGDQQVPIRWPLIAVAGVDQVDNSARASLFVSGWFALMEGEDVELRAGARIEARTVEPTSVTAEPGRIVFFRPRRNGGGAYRYGVRAGEFELRLRNGTFSEAEFAPGIYEFAIVGPFLGGAPQETLRLEVQPGETLYIEHAVDFLIVANQAKFGSIGVRPLED